MDILHISVRSLSKRPLRLRSGTSCYSYQLSRWFIQTAGAPQAFPHPPLLSELVSEEDNAAALQWVDLFKAARNKIPRSLVELTFSRSSGPGGQNVNKVNTKSALRCPLNAPWIPQWAVPALTKDSHYVASTHSILITSTTHRSQSQNVDECLQKLHALVLDSASSTIKKAPTAEQKRKIDGLMRADKERRKAEKMKRSSIKQGRSGRGGFDY